MGMGRKLLTAMVVPGPQGLLTKVALWLILATTLFGPSFESRPLQTIYHNARTTTTDLELASWPVITNDSVYVCTGNLTYTPPSTAHFVDLDCVDYGCNTARKLNRQASSAMFETQAHGQSFVHEDGADVYSCETTLTYTVDSDSTEDVGLTCEGPYTDNRALTPTSSSSSSSELECICEASSSSSSTKRTLSSSSSSLSSISSSSSSVSSSSSSSFSSSSQPLPLQFLPLQALPPQAHVFQAQAHQFLAFHQVLNVFVKTAHH